MKNKIQFEMPLIEAQHQRLHRLHDFIATRVKWYRSWHENKLAHRLHLAVMFLAVGMALTGVYWQSAVTHSTSLSTEIIYERTNEVRSEFKKNTLELDPALTKVAQEKAADMIEKGYFNHKEPDGKMIWDRVKASGYDYLYVGENIAKGYTNMDELVAAWLSSPTHRENMLDDNFMEMGIGMAEGQFQDKGNTQIVVEVFGTKKIEKPLDVGK